jgi:hypothetical protein
VVAIITIVLDQAQLHTLEVLHHQGIHKVVILHTITKDTVHLEQVVQEDTSTDIGVQMEDLEFA